MTREPRAFFALDRGAATTSAALVGYVGDRWRLMGHAALPRSSDAEALVWQLAESVRDADPALFAEIMGGDSAPAAAVRDWPRLEAASSAPRRIAVLAGSRRQRKRLADAAALAGWIVTSGSADEDDPFQLTGLILAPDTDAVLLGADASPAGDERSHLAQLATLVAAAASRRRDLDVVLAGGAAIHAAAFEEHGLSTEPADVDALSRDIEAGPEPATPGGRPPARGVLLAPDAAAGQPSGSALRGVLEGLRTSADDSRAGIARATASLAYVLDRSVEVVEVGLDGGGRYRADPYGEGHRSVASAHAILAAASFVPPEPTDAVVDAILHWSTVALDRYRLSDRLRELRAAPWTEVDGDGGLLRLAAARAAVERLVAATPEIAARPSPDLLIAAGGIWACAPAPVVALALADLIRRPGATQLAIDHARLLGPLGVIEDELERRRIVGDLVDDMLVPLGSLIMPTGLRLGRSAGRLRVRSGEATAEVDLQPGGIEVVDLPPGQTATADLDFRDTVRLGGRGRHFTAQVSGGLGGLLVDLRDVPLRLPERPDARRAVLGAWQRALWGEADV